MAFCHSSINPRWLAIIRVLAHALPRDATGAVEAALPGFLLAPRGLVAPERFVSPHRARYGIDIAMADDKSLR